MPDLPRVPVTAAHPDPAALAQAARDAGQGAQAGGGAGRIMLDVRPGAAPSATSCWRNDIPVTVGFRRQALYDGTLDNFAGDLGVGSDPA